MKTVLKLCMIAGITLLLCACSNQKIQTGIKGQTQNKYNVFFNMEGVNCTLEEAKTTIRRIITDQGYGYTEYMAYGAYVDDTKGVIENDTLVYMLIYVEEAKVKTIVEKAKQELGLKSVLYEVTSVYNGFAEEQ